jgi:hypothetical protein
VFYLASTTVTRCLTQLYRNGGAIKRGLDLVGVSGYGVNGNTIIYMDANDYIELWVYISAATAIYDDGASLSWWNAVLIRPESSVW